MAEVEAEAETGEESEVEAAVEELLIEAGEEVVVENPRYYPVEAAHTRWLEVEVRSL